MDTPKTDMAIASKKYQKASTVCCSANVLLFFAYQCAFFGRNFFSQNLARIFSSGSQNLEKIPGFFFVPFSLSRSLPPPLLACQSSSHSHFLVILYASFPTGKFEDFKALGALLELSIGYCKKIDCKKALEVLPTMPWAAQIQKLDLSHRKDVEGTAECSFVFGAPVRTWCPEFSLGIF